MENEQSTRTVDIEDVTPKGLFERFRSIITMPTDFFDNMPIDDSLKDSVIFVGAIAGIAGLGQIIVTAKPMMGVQYAIAYFAMSFVSGGILLLLSRGLGGKGNFSNTYRAFAYASAPMVVFWIPILGFIAGLYSLFLLRLSLERVHDLTSQRIFAVIGIYAVTMIGVAVTLAMMSLAALVSAKNAANMVGAP
jgi:hypothetical protein